VKCPIDWPVNTVEDALKDPVEDALKAAPSCKAAVDLFWACGTGGSRDAVRLQMVSEKCEADYARAKPLRLAAEREVKTCWRTAFRDFGPEGSMYRSWAAYCAASVHDRYSGRALRDKRLSPDKRSKAQPPPDFGWVEAARREAEVRDNLKGIEDDLPKSPTPPVR
jgi:hypothetical protein